MSEFNLKKKKTQIKIVSNMQLRGGTVEEEVYSSLASTFLRAPFAEIVKLVNAQYT